MSFWEKIKQTLRSFMNGRNGADHYSMALLWTGLVLYLLGAIVGSIQAGPIFVLLGFLFNTLGFAAYAYCIFRMFSRNISARVAENQKFINIRNRFANWRYFRQQKRGGRGGYNGGYSGQQGNTYYGDFSKSHEQAARENNRASRKGGTVYCYYYCPNCKQQVRVPAGKGKVRITCPRCEHKFETYS
jgi:hypothetical protein